MTKTTHLTEYEKTVMNYEFRLRNGVRRYLLWEKAPQLMSRSHLRFPGTRMLSLPEPKGRAGDRNDVHSVSESVRYNRG
jgi:hypothetical protein